ncbi:uncharacterized protein [Garra rufa]|uniref:uncharacterized protein n=1 Tax=Garra rufa TaxID=137080 RepID=UPI003CCE853A
MLRSRISNLPFLDGATNMYMTTNKSHFKLADNTTFRALSFPSHPPAPVVQPKLTHIFMHSTNFKLHSEDRDEDFQTTQSELKLLPMCAAKIIRPTTTVRTALPEGKYPETTYRSSYIKHQVSQIVRAKQPAKTGVRSSLIMDRRDRFRSSYQEQFQYRWFPRPPQSTEKEQMQYSSVVMGDQERTMDKQTRYSTSFRQSGDHRCGAA